MSVPSIPTPVTGFYTASARLQALAGKAAPADGEPSRFHVSLPETNGMSEYFIEPMGGIDAKDHAVDSADAVARGIGRAVDVPGAGRVKWVRPDCGFRMLPRHIADRKRVALVAGRDLCLHH